MAASLIVDILEEHLEELQFLWPQRRLALRSPRYTIRELGELESRIEAHVQGLLVGGAQTRAMLVPALAEDETAFAAGYVLLRFGKADLQELVLGALLEKPSEGLVEAFCHAPLEPILPKLRPMANTPPAGTSLDAHAALAEILGFQGKLDLKNSQMIAFLQHEDPKLRHAGWRIARYLPARSADLIEAGWKDVDPAVAGEALQAAAWCRYAPLLPHCRHALVKPAAERWDAIYLAAMLGTPGELGHMLQLARCAELGPLPYRALGAFGHPQGIPPILSGMESKDPLTAVAAGAAYAKITGFDVESSKRATVPPADGQEPDDFEREFLDEVKLPDAALAQAHWNKVKDAFAKGTRFCRGMDLSKATSDEQFAQLDMESRWESRLRTRYERVGPGTPASHARLQVSRAG